MKTCSSINIPAVNMFLVTETKVWCETNLPTDSWSRVLYGDMRHPPFSYAWTYIFEHRADLVAFKLKFGI